MTTARAAAVAAGGLAVCAWCGWVSGFHRSTGAAVVTWVVSLAAVVAVDTLLWAGGRAGRQGPARQGPARPPGRRRWYRDWRLAPATAPWPRPGRGGAGPALAGTTPWLALVLVAVVWEILGIDTGPHTPHLTISALAQQYRAMNAALMLVWFVAGFGYGVARARTPTAPDSDTPRRVTGTGGPAALAVVGTPVGRAGLLGHAVGPATVPGLLLPAWRPAGVAFWLAWVAAIGLIDLVARRTGGRVPDAEEFLRFITRPAWANAVLVAAWTFAGWHLFAR